MSPSMVGNVILPTGPYRGITHIRLSATHIPMYTTSKLAPNGVMHRPVGSGAAWRRSPHQKSAGRKREKEENERKREEGRRKEEKKERKRDGSKSERCIEGVKNTNIPSDLSKHYERNGKKGRQKSGDGRDRKGRKI